GGMDVWWFLSQGGVAEPLHPLVEITEDDLGAPDAAIVHDGLQAPRLIAPFEKRGSQMNVVKMKLAIAEGAVHSLAPARLAGLPREVVVGMVDDRVPAEDDVAEQAAATMTGRCHHTAPAQERAELLRVG